MTIYWVAITGNDGNAGTQGSPWLTLQHASDTMVAGDTTMVLPGLYDQTSSTWTYLRSLVNGTALAPITWKAVVPGTVKLTTSNSTAVQTWLIQADYIYIIGFDLTGTGTLVNEAIRVIGTGCWLDRCLFHDTPVGQGVFFDPTGSGNNITRSKIFNTGTPPASNQYHGIYCAQAGGGLIQNNIIWNVPGWGVQLWTNSTGAIVSNNTIFACGNGGIVVGGVSPSVDTSPVVANNILYNNTGYGLREAGTVGQVVTPIYTNNCFSGNSLGDSGLLTSGASVLNSVSADPQFVEYRANGSGNYHLKSTSPCIDAGTAVNVPLNDYEGTNRPQGSAYDIGAFEFVPAQSNKRGGLSLIG